MLRVLGRILDGNARLVGEFAEVDLVAVACLAEHADIGAGAEHVVLAGAHHHRAYLRVLEAQALDGVVQFDVDGEIVGIELELAVGKQPARRVDVHDELRDFAVGLDPPVAIAAGLSLEIDEHGPSQN